MCVYVCVYACVGSVFCVYMWVCVCTPSCSCMCSADPRFHCFDESLSAVAVPALIVALSVVFARDQYTRSNV